MLGTVSNTAAQAVHEPAGLVMKVCSASVEAAKHASRCHMCHMHSKQQSTTLVHHTPLLLTCRATAASPCRLSQPSSSPCTAAACATVS